MENGLGRDSFVGTMRCAKRSQIAQRKSAAVCESQTGKPCLLNGRIVQHSTFSQFWFCVAVVIAAWQQHTVAVDVSLYGVVPSPVGGAGKRGKEKEAATMTVFSFV